jgi:hypothetical protein
MGNVLLDRLAREQVLPTPAPFPNLKQVLVTPEAAIQLEARKNWWRANRPATADLFDRKFLDAVA